MASKRKPIFVSHNTEPISPKPSSLMKYEEEKALKTSKIYPTTEIESQ